MSIRSEQEERNQDKNQCIKYNSRDTYARRPLLPFALLQQSLRFDPRHLA